MPLSDLPLEQLQAYRYPRSAPAGLEAFWSDTLAQARAAGGELTVTPADTGVTAFDISDVTFPGFAGEPIKAWWTRPKDISDDLPVVVEYIGYGGGRGLPHERMLWAAHGFHHFVVDTRGQGSMLMSGDTPDPYGSGPAANGYFTRGVDDPQNLYYRRVFTDAARAVDAVRTLPGVRADRVGVWGHSQGGGLAMATAALVPDVAACGARTPFLCGIQRSAEVSSAGPFLEVVNYQATHRDLAERAAAVLDHVDVALLAPWIRCPVWVAVALMDTICPPSGIYGAINNLTVPAQVVVRPFNGHEGGAAFDEADVARWFADQLLAA